jgi:ATP-dependent RNA helicase DDX20
MLWKLLISSGSIVFAKTLMRATPAPQIVRISKDDPSLEGVLQYYQVVSNQPDELNYHDNNNSARILSPHQMFAKKVAAVVQLLSEVEFHQCVLFSNNKTRAHEVTHLLQDNGWPAVWYTLSSHVSLRVWFLKYRRCFVCENAGFFVSSSLLFLLSFFSLLRLLSIAGGQTQRERLRAIAALREFRVRVLVSTDLTSRGVDVERISLVINLDLPSNPNVYLHRVGRTGRFGSRGLAVTIVGQGTGRISVFPLLILAFYIISTLTPFSATYLSSKSNQLAFVNGWCS